MKKKVVIKQWHSRGCCIEGTDREHYLPGIPDERLPTERLLFFGNYAGNQSSRGNFHYWMSMRCNDPKCHFYAVLSVDTLSQLIKDKP
jgi:hypothetical protein